MRPVTPSRRNEKNRERSVDRAPGAAADALTRPRAASRSRARPAQVGAPARLAVGARLVAEARAAAGSGSAPKACEHVGADLERVAARCTGPSQATRSRGAHDAPPHTACDRCARPRRRPGRASRRARRRPRAPCGAASSTGRQSATMHRAGHAGLGWSTRRRRRRLAPCALLGVERAARGRRAPGAGRPAWRRWPAAKRARLAAHRVGRVAADRGPRFRLSHGARADAAGARGHQRADARSASHSGSHQDPHGVRLTRHPGIRTAASCRTPAAACRPRTRASSCGTWSIRHLKRCALKICGTRQQSARVGVSPWQ